MRGGWRREKPTRMAGRSSFIGQSLFAIDRCISSKVRPIVKSITGPPARCDALVALELDLTSSVTSSQGALSHCEATTSHVLTNRNLPEPASPDTLGRNVVPERG